MPDTTLMRSTLWRRLLRNAPALACYLAALTMGVLYRADIATATALATTTDGATATAWQYCLIFGGIIGLAGTTVVIPSPSLWPRALVADMIGAAMVALCLSIYVPIVWVGGAGSTPPWATICWVGAVCIALWARALWCYVERGDRLDVEAALAVTEIR